MADGRDIELLVAILGALEALPGRIAGALAAGALAAGGSRTSQLSAMDQRVLQLLVPAAAQAIGDMGFSAQALLAQAQTADRGLLEHLDRAIGPIDAGSARKLGRLLARAGNTLIGGVFVIERSGASRAGAIWRIVRVSKLADSRERLRVAAASGQDRGHV